MINTTYLGIDVQTKGIYDDTERTFVERITTKLRQRYVGKNITFHLQNAKSEELRAMLKEMGLRNGEQYKVREVHYQPVSEGIGTGLERTVTRVSEPFVSFEVDVNGRNILLGGYLFGEKP